MISDFYKEGDVQKWYVEYTHEEGGVFTAISKKDQVFIKMIGPYLRHNLSSRGWYLIQLTEKGASLTITIKDDTTEKSSGDNPESS